MDVGRELVALQVEVEANDKIMEVVRVFMYLGGCSSEDGCQ